jgi:hypothetical protein
MNFCELILKNDSNLILSAVGVFTLQKSLKTTTLMELKSLNKNLPTMKSLGFKGLASKLYQRVMKLTIPVSCKLLQVNRESFNEFSIILMPHLIKPE